MIIKHKIVRENNEDVLVVYLDQGMEEFAKLGENAEDSQKNLLHQISDYIKEKNIDFKGKVVKVLAGGLLLATLALTPGIAGNVNNVSAATAEPAQTYVVEPGDNLSVIAYEHGISVDDLREINHLTSDIIYPGQALQVSSSGGIAYTVQSGDNLSVIASKHNMTVLQLKQLNNLTSDVIQPGQILFVSETGATSTYTVQSGDNLSVIASRHNMTVTQLKQLNNLTSDVIQPGQTLMVSETGATNNVTTTYTVQSGDNLSVIAKNHNMTVTQLKQLNNLTSDVIQPGQMLVVSEADETGTYTVQSGDNLSVIASRHNMTVSQLIEMNHLTSDIIQPGQELRVIGEATPQTYTVRSGDSLWSIARVHDMTVSELQAINNLGTTVLQPGQVIYVSNNQTETIPANNQYMMVSVRRTNGVVETIALEDYVAGVVASELGPGFNQGSYQAQAVAARTYAAKRVEQGKTLSDTDYHQVYRDTNQLRSLWGEREFNESYPDVVNAVNSTRGQVLKYNGEYIDALYFSTSNGRTDEPSYVWGGDLPYLRSVESSWDTKSPYYFHSNTYSYSEFASRLSISTSHLYATVLSRTANGSVYTINISGRVFSGRHVQRQLGLRSNDFDIHFSNGVVTIEQRGWGHGVGMSQYGAYFMAQEGHSYQDILRHYYQNVDIVPM